ncbi:uncharacterized protein J3D65DRAFT_479456 [Phyllosticta citribraziliensis]|uniref:Uncharacterized protein n=1 Tax=Phyllosticta citribraziliensis TaxID=989973 RepID=A0ABR1LGC1_9PEZI
MGQRSGCFHCAGSNGLPKAGLAQRSQGSSGVLVEERVELHCGWEEWESTSRRPAKTTHHPASPSGSGAGPKMQCHRGSGTRLGRYCKQSSMTLIISHPVRSVTSASQCQVGTRVQPWFSPSRRGSGPPGLVVSAPWSTEQPKDSDHGISSPTSVFHGMTNGIADWQLDRQPVQAQLSLLHHLRQIRPTRLLGRRLHPRQHAL